MVDVFPVGFLVDDPGTDSSVHAQTGVLGPRPEIRIHLVDSVLVPNLLFWMRFWIRFGGFESQIRISALLGALSTAH